MATIPSASIKPVALITGASSGIGHSLARVLARRGYAVGLVARRQMELSALAEQIRQAGGQVAVAVADVAQRRELAAAVQQIRESLGPIDLLVANAGVGQPDRLTPFSVDSLEWMMRVNYLGVVYSIDAVLPEMLSRRQGHLSVVSSLGGYLGIPGSAGYAATKAAVNTLFDGLRVQSRGTGITVTTICPGFIRTPMTARNRVKMPWLLEPDDAAERIANALKRRVKKFHFPWQMSILMGILRRLPDWALARLVPLPRVAAPSNPNKSSVVGDDSPP